jgi:hypothetical protein
MGIGQTVDQDGRGQEDQQKRIIVEQHQPAIPRMVGRPPWLRTGAKASQALRVGN